MDNRNNRSLTDEELYSLLKKLNVSSLFIGKDYLTFVEKVNQLNSTFGNPFDKQSMLDLSWLLISLQVNIWDENNRRLIDNAVYNKKMYFGNVNEEELETYIKMVMLELGFKASVNGFEVFKDAVLYLLENKDVLNFTNDLYPMLSKKHNISLFAVERCLKNLIDLACREYSSNRVTDYVYGNKKHITVSECLYSVTDYVKFNYKDNYIIMKDKYAVDKNLIENSECLEQIVSGIINNLGIFSNINGYRYLRDMVLKILCCDGEIEWLKFYSELADVYAIAPFNIERSIRFAITKSKKRYAQIKEGMIDVENITGVEKFIYQYCRGFANSEFITLLVEYIKLNVNKIILDDYKIQKEIQVLKKIRKN